MIVIMNEKNIIKEYEFTKPEIDEVDYLLDKVKKIVKRSFSIHLYIDVCMILKLQILQIL